MFLTLGALLPYWPLLTFGVVFITDDYFASDIYNGELPGRVLIGRLLREGQWPVWTNQLCSGLPLAGSSADPIGLASFTLLSPAAALDAFVIVLLLVAAHGAYGLARRFGADRTGAVLAGIAFAGSGYIACQLKHLAIVSTVVWLPAGLILLDRALAPGDVPRARRSLCIALFGLVFAQQVLCGFPQSAYICALVYAAFVAFHAIVDRGRVGSPRAWIALLGGIGLATALGGAAGAVVLLPLSALGSVSDRASALGYDWSTRLAYWPPNALTFLFPYAHGDISDNSYTGPPFFWEDYGYVGFATVLLAFYGAIRERKRPVVSFSILMTLVAYLFVLGNATPVFRVAYLLIPGLKLFRFPTRFLIVVELGLALLAAVGLTRLQSDLAGVVARRAEASAAYVASAFRRKLPAIAAIAICAATALDLFIHQPRQNPMVSAREWLAPPASADLVRAGGTQPRTFTPQHRDLHRATFVRASGWANVTPYYEMRDLLQPNIGGGFWNVPSADCYAGIAARWYINVWGDHNREASVVSLLAALDFNTRDLRVHPVFGNVLRAYGVTHVLSPFPQAGTALPFAGRAGNAYVYRVEGTARVRFVPAARVVADDNEAVTRILDPAFDPGQEVLLHDAPPDAGRPRTSPADGSAPGGAWRADITRETSREIAIEADAPQDGFLLLADTFYPGWTADVDGQAAPIYRANLYVRGIPLPRGRHQVRLAYDPPGFRRGLAITLVAISMLILWTAAACYADRRARR